ncbi:hypothetical protein JCGZ_11908 [Jatropha curcas]|uniref:Aminotransferase-like plant mobile domain-containing protein n=1 Tax=Jatropha curcas TaxID=180498 RepID=A0A067KSG2_JATCU|nr:hypothetical protein JCGZ_11908 [Jatropha curcas]
MSQLPEIPASAYTPEMNTLGAIPDIPTFKGEPVPISRNPLTSGMRPLQLLPLPGIEFPVRYETSRMRGFQTEARAGGSSTDASAFWDLLDPPMRARVVAAGFGDYATGLRRTQPRCPPAMRYALMERWNDCTHTFVFGFGEMTLTPADYAAITGLRFDGPVAPLDARYQTAALGAQLNKGDPAALVCLRDLSQVGSYDWATPALAHLYHSLNVWTRGSGESNWQFIRSLEVWAYKYRIYPGDPSGDTPVDSRRIPQYLAHCHHTFASTEDPHYWRCFLNDRALSDALDKLSLILPVPVRLIPTYGPANFRSRSRGHFDFGDNPTIRWTCPWWRIRLVTTGSMNLNYVLYASLDRSMAYFPDRVSRQYGMIQRVPRIHDFESGLMTPSFLIHMSDRWRN